MGLWVLGLGDDIMSYTARWAFKSLAFSAIINCAAQEYDTLSTTNDKPPLRIMGRGLPEQQYIVEYSREGSKPAGANPSEAVLGIWACNVPVREHQASAVRACIVLVQEHQAS